MPAYVLLPGAGSAGRSWEALAERLDETSVILPIPDAPDVPAMAAGLAPRLRELTAPLVLVGASLGAMVAMELARDVELEALVLIAAGFGIEVSESLLEWVAADPPDLLAKVAKASIGARDNQPMIDFVAQDFASRGQPVLLRHLRALGAYRPEPLQTPPPTLVIWGVEDHSVPLADHVELALRCRGALAPVRDAGHMPFLEQPAETARWLRMAPALAGP